MKSFLPVFQNNIEEITTLLVKDGFVFEKITDNLSLDKLSIERFLQSFDAKFTRKNETIFISCSYSKTGKLSLDCSYHNKNKGVVFFLEYYLRDNRIQGFPQSRIISSHKNGTDYILKYLSELKVNIESLILSKIRSGTIDNHYYQLFDPYR